jgi:hypothetical protein
MEYQTEEGSELDMMLRAGAGKGEEESDARTCIGVDGVDLRLWS